MPDFSDKSIPNPVPRFIVDEYVKALAVDRCFFYDELARLKLLREDDGPHAALLRERLENLDKILAVLPAPDMTLKRDNWTNAEVIAILRGMELKLDGAYPALAGPWNEAIEGVIQTFEDFACDHTKFPAAKAYHTERDEIVVIGPKLPQ